MFEFGKIVLVPFPFTDLTSTKIRPALIVSNDNSSDVIVAFITSKSKKLVKTDYVIGQSDVDFKETGLKTDSVIVLNKMATINKKIILGELGCCSVKLLKKIKPVFEGVFGFL